MHTLQKLIDRTEAQIAHLDQTADAPGVVVHTSDTRIREIVALLNQLPNIQFTQTRAVLAYGLDTARIAASDVPHVHLASIAQAAIVSGRLGTLIDNAIALAGEGPLATALRNMKETAS